MLKWKDKQNGVDDVLAEDINDIAHAVIDLQENDKNNTVDQTYTPTSPNAQSGLATAEAVGVANDYTDKAIKSSKTYANNTFAPAIKNTVSGSVLAVHDVSSVEHALNIKLSSDTLTDFSNVGVSRYGKNLSPTNTLEVQGIGSWTSKQLIKANIPSGVYTFSCEYEFLNENNTTVAAAIRDINENYIVETFGNNSVLKITFTVTNGLTIHLYSNFGGTVIDNDVLFKNIQLELGTTATDYEPYIEPQTVIANADGTVDGLTSLSPDMTIMTDTEGVVIDMTYNADTKMYIDNKLAEISAAIVNS